MTARPRRRGPVLGLALLVAALTTSHPDATSPARTPEAAIAAYLAALNTGDVATLRTLGRAHAPDLHVFIDLVLADRGGRDLRVHQQDVFVLTPRKATARLEGTRVDGGVRVAHAELLRLTGGEHGWFIVLLPPLQRPTAPDPMRPARADRP
ncbi:hypothetical protein ACOBQX_01650 [Actinokineospora sp. G85]|uniref:hypothetical protein n=1 Tax=Actinokineospora sp. G85 TaxID=3406626 RepID=UPI003C793D44